MKIAKETWIILGIGLADLATTILFIQHHGAEEANPIFRRYWEMGLAVFVAAKVALLVGPLYVLEWARVRNPKFVSWALRSAIAAYVLMYGVGYYRLNNEPRASATYAELVAPALPLPQRLAHRMRPYYRSIHHELPSQRSESAAVTVSVN